MEVFPRVTKCTFHKYGSSGTVMKLDALCVLGLNIINEKIYITLWFWFVILAILTACYTVYIVALISMPSLRRSLVTRKASGSNKDQAYHLVDRADIGTGSCSSSSPKTWTAELTTSSSRSSLRSSRLKPRMILSGMLTLARFYCSQMKI